MFLLVYSYSTVSVSLPCAYRVAGAAGKRPCGQATLFLYARRAIQHGGYAYCGAFACNDKRRCRGTLQRKSIKEAQVFSTPHF